jgi:hypothetical protein
MTSHDLRELRAQIYEEMKNGARMKRLAHREGSRQDEAYWRAYVERSIRFLSALDRLIVEE